MSASCFLLRYPLKHKETKYSCFIHAYEENLENMNTQKDMAALEICAPGASDIPACKCMG